jgi:glycosyltransferase involved in cell wall biosynthesis
MNISVCIAVYNGAHYVRKQVESILPQLQDIDEIVVVVDCSEDESVAVPAGFHDHGNRVIRKAENLGFVRTFEPALP